MSIQDVLKGTALKLSARRAFEGLGAYERGCMGEEMS